MKSVIHHTGSYAKSNSRQLFSVNRSHQNRFHFKSSLGYYVGYHFFIERSGAFTQTRSVEELGAHTYNERTNTGYNHYIGICLAGDMRTQQPTKKQLDALRRILTLDLKIPYGNVYLHRDLDDTECPGAHLSHDVVADLYEKTKVVRAARKLLLRGHKYWDIVKGLLSKV